MPDAVEVAIESALLDHLRDMLPSPDIPVAWPNVKFTPPTSGPNVYWLRATFLPANTFGLGVGDDSSNQHYGIFQVDVFYGQGSGDLAPVRIATDVIAWFTRGTTLIKDGFTVKVPQPPRRATTIKDDPWVMVPVSVPYLAFASNPS